MIDGVSEGSSLCIAAALKRISNLNIVDHVQAAPPCFGMHNSSGAPSLTWARFLAAIAAVSAVCLREVFPALMPFALSSDKYYQP
jgi:hypothetical protein